MTDHYKVLGLEKSASQEDIAEAFEQLLAVRRSRRQKTSDLHAALAVVGDPSLRRAYDLAVFGKAATERVTQAAVQAKELIPDVDVQELAQQAREVVLKAVVLATGVTARVGDATAAVSRTVQAGAAKQLRRDVERRADG